MLWLSSRRILCGGWSGKWQRASKLTKTLAVNNPQMSVVWFFFPAGYTFVLYELPFRPLFQCDLEKSDETSVAGPWPKILRASKRLEKQHTAWCRRQIAAFRALDEECIGRLWSYKRFPFSLFLTQEFNHVPHLTSTVATGIVKAWSSVEFWNDPISQTTVPSRPNQGSRCGAMAPKLHLPPAAIRKSWEEQISQILLGFIIGHIMGTSWGISPTIWGGSINGELPNSWLVYDVYFTVKIHENPTKMDEFANLDDLRGTSMTLESPTSFSPPRSIRNSCAPPSRSPAGNAAVFGSPIWWSLRDKWISYRFHSLPE